MVVVPPARNQRGVPVGSGQQLIFGGGARRSHGGPDAASRGRDLRVGCALGALLEFGGAIAGEDGMRVRVDEPGHDDAACRRR